jgi:hypothetical protein
MRLITRDYVGEECLAAERRGPRFPALGGGPLWRRPDNPNARRSGAAFLIRRRERASL